MKERNEKSPLEHRSNDCCRQNPLASAKISEHNFKEDQTWALPQSIFPQTC